VKVALFTRKIVVKVALSYTKNRSESSTFLHQRTIKNRQIYWTCQNCRFINLQLTNTIYKRQTTNDNCHSDQILGFWFHKAIVTNHICKIIMHNLLNLPT
jgi:hypothetical protein